MRKTEIRTPFDALEVNLGAFLERRLKRRHLPLQILVTNSDEEMAGEGHVLEIDAHTDINDEGAVMFDVAVQITLSSHDSKPRIHKQLAADIFEAIFCVPQPRNRRLRATPEVLRALNRVPGEPDNRPGPGIHVWDLNGPSMSMGPEGQTLKTFIVARAQLQPGNWKGALPYGQFDGLKV
jgi:hypothetical protein